MLEQYATNWLTKYLRKYVRMGEQQQLQLSLWSGELNLSCLELNPDAIIPSGSPIVCERGFVKTLKVRIPWTRLQSEPVSITLEGVSILLRPKKGSKWDKETHEREAKEAKNAALELFEKGRLSKTEDNDEKQDEKTGFFSRIQDIVSSNIQVKVNNVHIKYEDCDIHPHNPISLGISFSSLSCVSTDQNWTPGFITHQQTLLYKLLSLEGLKVSLSPIQKSEMLVDKYSSGKALSDEQKNDFFSEIKSLISSTEYQILEPFGLFLRLRVQKGGVLNYSVPRVTSSVKINPVRLRLTRRQYIVLLNTIDYCNKFTEIDEFRRFRPTTRVHNHAKDWWHFSYKSVTHLIRERRNRRRYIPEETKQFRLLGEEYSSLWKREQRVPWLPSLTPLETIRLKQLHEELKLHHLTWWREVAYAELQVDSLQYEVQLKNKELPITSNSGTAAKQNTSWAGVFNPMGYLPSWRGRVESPPVDAVTELRESTWSETERKKLSAIGLLESTSQGWNQSGIQPPEGYIDHNFTCVVELAQVQLLSPSSILGELQIFDTQFRNGAHDSYKLSIGNLDITSNGDCLVTKIISDREEPLLATSVSNTSVSVALTPLDIVLDRNFVSKVVEFFKPPPQIDLMVQSTLRELATDQFRELIQSRSNTGFKLTADVSTVRIPFLAKSTDRNLPQTFDIVKSGGSAVKYQIPASSGSMIFSLESVVISSVMSSDGVSSSDYSVSCNTISVSTISGLGSQPQPMIFPFDVRMTVSRQLLSSELSALADISRINIKFSRQNLLMLLYISDLLTKLVNSLSPEIPESLTVDSRQCVQSCIDGFMYDQALLCTFQQCEKAEYKRAYPGVLLVYKNEVLCYGQSVEVFNIYHLRAVYKLGEAPFRVSQSGGDSDVVVELELPQAFGPTKKLILSNFVDEKSSVKALHCSLSGIQQRAVTGRKSRDASQSPKMILNFVLGELAVDLHGEDSDTRSCGFARLQFDEFKTKIIRRSHDMSVDLSLTSLCCSGSSSIPSEDGIFASAPRQDSDLPLVTMSYLTCAEQSSYWRKDGPDMRLKLAAQTLHLTLTPAFVAVSELLYDCLGVNKVACSTAVPVHYAAPYLFQPTRGDESKDPTRIDSQIESKMCCLKISCLDEVEEGSFKEFLNLSMTDAVFVVKLSESCTRVEGKLGNLQADECDFATGKITSLCSLADDCLEDNLTEFLYTSPNNVVCNGDTNAVVSGTVTAVLRQVRSTFHYSILQHVIIWGTTGSIVSGLQAVPSRLVTTTTTLPDDFTEEPSFHSIGGDQTTGGSFNSITASVDDVMKPKKISIIEMTLQLVNPLVSLPAMKTVERGEQLVADLGTVTVKTRLERTPLGTPITQMQMMLKKVSLRTTEGHIANELSFGLTTTQSLTTPIQTDAVSTMDFSVGRVHMSLSDSQWGLLMEVVAHNLMNTYKPLFSLPEVNPPPGLRAPVMSIRNFNASELILELQQSVTLKFTEVNLLMTEGDDSSGSTRGTLQRFCMETLGCKRPLVDFLVSNSSEAAVTADIISRKNSPTEINICLASPVVYLDPDLLLLAQDTLACEEAVSAMNHILQKSADNPSSSIPSQEPNSGEISAIFNAEMESLTIFGLKAEEDNKPFFKATASATKIRCSMGGEDRDMEVLMDLGDAHLYSVIGNTEEDVFGLPASDHGRDSLLKIAFVKNEITALDEPPITTAQITLQGLRVVVVSSFWKQFLLWTDPTEGPLSKISTIGMLKSERFRPLVTKLNQKTNVIINWHGPHAVIPQLGNRDKSLIATLGHLQLTHSDCGSDVLLKNVRVHHKGIAVDLPNTTDIDIVRDFDVEMHLSPNNNITTNIGTITVHLSNAQVRFVNYLIREQIDAMQSVLSTSLTEVSKPVGVDVDSSTSVSVDVHFSGLRLLIDDTTGGIHSPLTQLQMSTVVASYVSNPNSESLCKISLLSICVKDRSGVVTGADSTVVRTNPIQHDDHTESLPCLVIESSTDTTIKLRSIHFTLYPEYLVSIGKFIQACTAGMESVSPRREFDDKKNNTRNRTELIASLDQLTVGIHDGSRLLATMELAGGQINVRGGEDDALRISGLMSTVRVHDESTVGTQLPIVVQPSSERIVNTNNESNLFVFEMLLYSTPVSGYTRHVEASMNSLTFTYSAVFLKTMSEFISSKQVECVLTSFTTTDPIPEEVNVTTRSSKFPCLASVLIENPIIVIPENHKTRDGVILDLGRIAILTSMDSVTETLSVNVSNFGLSTTSSSVQVGNVISGSLIECTLVVSKSLDEMNVLKEVQNDISISCKPLQLLLDKNHWMQLLKVGKSLSNTETPKTTKQPTQLPRSSVLVNAKFNLPHVSVLLQNCGDPFVLFAVSGIAANLVDSPSMREQSAECCIAGAEVKQVWRQGSSYRSRNLLSRSDSATPHDSIFSMSLKTAEKISTSVLQVVMRARLPSFLFIPPLIRDFEDTLLGPYNEVFSKVGPISKVEEIVIEESLLLNEDLFLSPHKVLRLSSKKVNCIEIDGGSTRTMHLVREPGCTRHCIIIEDGLTVRLKNITIRSYCSVYGRGLLEDHCTIGDGSYWCVVGNTQIVSEIREVERPIQPSIKSSSNGSLKKIIDIRFDVLSGGIGISGNINKNSEKPQRCIMLNCTLREARYYSESVLSDASDVTSEVTVDELKAVHVLIQPPMPLHNPYEYNPSSLASQTTSSSDTAFIVEPTSAEMLYSDPGARAKSSKLQIIIPHVRMNLCLSDTRLVSEFSQSLSVFNRVETERDKGQNHANDKKINMGTNIGEFQLRVIDDSRGKPLPVGEIFLKGVAVSSQFDSDSNDNKIGALASPSVNFYNSDLCEWEPLVESCDVEIKIKKSEISNVVEISTTRVNTNITPAVFKCAQRTSKLLSLMKATPLPRQAAYELLNETGRDLCIYTGCDETVGMKTIKPGCSLSFDTSKIKIKTAVVMNQKSLEDLHEPISGEKIQNPWHEISIAAVGVFDIGNGFLTDIINKESCRQITYRTPVVLKNDLFSTGFHITGVGAVKSNGSICIPHDRLTKSEGFSLRPLSGFYKEATLGYSCGNLGFLPKKWTSFTVRCPASIESESDMCFLCTISSQPAMSNTAKSTPVHDVVVRLRPIFKIVNQLPIKIEVTASVDNRLISGEIPSLGGVFELTQAGHNWPNCKIKMSISAMVGGSRVQTTREVLVYHPSEGERSTSCLMIDKESGSEFCPLLSYSKSNKYGVVIYAPIWVRNQTEYDFQIYCLDSVVGSLVEGVHKNNTPCPIAPKPSRSDPQAGIKRLFLRLDKLDGAVAPIPLQTASMTSSCSVSLKHPKVDLLDCNIGCHIDTVHWGSAVSEFPCSVKIVNLVPRWVFQNKTSSEVSVRIVLPAGTRPAFIVKSHESRQCCSSSRHNDSRIEVRFTSDSSTSNRFSRPFSVSREHTLDLRLNFEPRCGETFIPTRGIFKGNTAPDGSPEYFNVIRVSTQEVNGCMNVTFTDCVVPPYIIENRTKYPMKFWLQGLQPPFKRTLPPLSTVPYALDDPFLPPKLVVSVCSQGDSLLKEVAVRLDKPAVDRQKVVLGSGASPIWIKVRYSKAALTSVLAITEEHYLPGKGGSGGTTQKGRTSITNISLAGIGLSVSLPMRLQDILYMSISKIIINIKPEVESHIAILAGDIQIDDVSSNNPTYPVILQRKVDRFGDDNSAPSPFLLIEFLQNHQTSEIIVARLLRMQLTPMRICMTDDTLALLLLFYIDVCEVTKFSDPERWKDFSYIIPSGVGGGDPGEKSFFNKKASIEDLTIHPIDILGTLTRTSSNQDIIAYVTSRYWWFNYLVTIDNTTLSWDSCHYPDINEPVGVVINRILSMYKHRLFSYSHLGKIASSMGIIGNPGALLKGVTRGVTGLITHSYNDLSVGGATKGVKSFIGNMGSGLAESLTSFTRTASRNVGSFGVLDAFSNGIDWYAGLSLTGYNRLREMRYFKPAGILVPYTTDCPNSIDETSITEYDFVKEIQECKSLIQKGVSGAILKQQCSMWVLARSTTWDQFRSLCTVEEFYNNAYLARDVYLVRASPSLRVPDAKMKSDITRVQHLHDTLDIARLISDPSLQVKLSELALVTSWDEFRALLTPQLFYQNASFARDRCLLSTIGFTVLQSK